MNYNLKIIAYNGFSIHHEMIGFIADYCSLFNYSLDVYTNFVNNLGWIEFYSKQYNNIKFIPSSEFTTSVIDKAHYCIYLTDDDFTLNFKGYVSYTNKFIAINHVKHIRNRFINKKIFLRPNHSDNYLIPTYSLIDLEEKKTILSKENKINIIAIGRAIDINILDQLLLIENCNIYYITNNTSFTKENINILYNIDAFTLISLLKRMHYCVINRTEHNNA